jgi:hypothetical protein
MTNGPKVIEMDVKSPNQQGQEAESDILNQTSGPTAETQERGPGDVGPESSDPSHGGAQESPVPAMPGGGNMEMIRKILFGGKMREYEERSARLEESVARDMQRLRDDLIFRIDSLEQFVKGELERVSDKVQGNRREMGNTAQEFKEAMSKLQQDLNASIVGLNDQYIKDTRDIRQRLHMQANETLEKLRQQYDQMTVTVERLTDQLQDVKMDRDELSGLLTEMALRIKRQFDITGIE